MTLITFAVNVEFVLNAPNEAEARLTVENFVERFPHVLIDGTDGVVTIESVMYLGEAAVDG